MQLAAVDEEPLIATINTASTFAQRHLWYQRLLSPVRNLLGFTQCLLDIAFLVLAMMKLRQPPCRQSGCTSSLTWYEVFVPLWFFDVIAGGRVAHELVRVWRIRTTRTAEKRNVSLDLISRLVDLTSSASLKVLISLHADGIAPGIGVATVVTPLLVNALVDVWIFYCFKKRVVPPAAGGRHYPPQRPGWPCSFKTVFGLNVGGRAAGVLPIPWAVAFWPLWIFLGLFALGALLIALLCCDHHARRRHPLLVCLGFPCAATIAVSGIVSASGLCIYLDDPEHGAERISVERIFVPLILAYAVVPAYYAAFLASLKRLGRLHAGLLALESARGPEPPEPSAADLHRLIMEAEERLGSPFWRKVASSGWSSGRAWVLAEGEDAGGFTSRASAAAAVTQLLAPPLLVQQSSTFFRRVGAATQPGWPTGGSLGSTGTSDEEVMARVAEELAALEAEVTEWVRGEQQKLRATPSSDDAANPNAPSVPAHVKTKLRRLIALKEQIETHADRSGGGASGASIIALPDASTPGGTTSSTPPFAAADAAPLVDGTPRGEQTCSICYEGPRDAVLLECGHGGICCTCALTALRKRPGCPICRQRVTQVVQLRTLSSEMEAQQPVGRRLVAVSKATPQAPPFIV